MISASLAAWLRLSSTSQPKTRIVIRWSSRTHMNRDLAATGPSGQTAGHSTYASFEAVHGGRREARHGERPESSRARAKSRLHGHGQCVGALLNSAELDNRGVPSVGFQHVPC